MNEQSDPELSKAFRLGPAATIRRLLSIHLGREIQQSELELDPRNLAEKEWRAKIIASGEQFTITASPHDPKVIPLDPSRVKRRFTNE